MVVRLDSSHDCSSGLEIGIYRGLELVRTFFVDDPRIEVCRSYNSEMNPHLEARPHPVSSATVRAKAKRREE